MKKRYYKDTSVFGGYFDQEFAVTTKELFAEIQKSETIILISEMTENELSEAPGSVKDFVKILPSKNIEFLEINPETIDLADKYYRRECRR